MHSVNYKDYLNLVLKGAGLCLFEVDVEKQRYIRFENAESIYQVSGEKVLSDLEEFSSLTPDAYMKAVSDYFVHPDDFKAINDNFGHDTGDRVLLKAVKQLREFFPRPSLIGRFGGDEFMVLCPFSQKELLEETINHFMGITIPPYSVKYTHQKETTGRADFFHKQGPYLTL